MAYLVSARRWRPQTFDDLVGQEHVTRTLTNAIRAGRVAHALPVHRRARRRQDHRGAHPRQGAELREGPDADALQRVRDCREITAGSSVDVLEIDGASNTGVDDVREIIENVRYQAGQEPLQDLHHRRSAHALHAAPSTRC